MSIMKQFEIKYCQSEEECIYKKMVHCEQLGFIPGMQIHSNIIEHINVIYSIHRSEEKHHLILIDIEKNSR